MLPCIGNLLKGDGDEAVPALPKQGLNALREGSSTSSFRRRSRSIGSEREFLSVVLPVKRYVALVEAWLQQLLGGPGCNRVGVS